MRLWKQIYELTMAEIRVVGIRRIMVWIVFIGVFGFNGANFSRLIGVQTIGGPITMIFSIYFLIMLPALGKLLLVRPGYTRNYYRNDPMTKWQAQLRILPVPYSAMMAAKITQMVVMMLVSGTIFFIGFYMGVSSTMKLLFEYNYISFAVVWLAYGITFLAILTYAELTRNSKVYSWFSYSILGCLPIIEIILYVFDKDVFMNSLHWVKVWPLLAPITMLLIAALGLYGMWYGVRKKLIYRDLM